MKNIVAIILLVAVLLSASAKTAAWGWYMANRNYIAANLCENKAKPKMKCNGKCQLAKQLKKAEGESSTAPVLPPALKEVKESEADIESYSLALAPTTQTIQATFVYNVVLQEDATTALLRPPIA